jgi:hypothetical protein
MGISRPPESAENSLQCRQQRRGTQGNSETLMFQDMRAGRRDGSQQAGNRHGPSDRIGSAVRLRLPHPLDEPSRLADAHVSAAEVKKDTAALLPLLGAPSR